MNAPLDLSLHLHGDRERTPEEWLFMAMFEPPISFNRHYVPITGRVTAALALSHAVDTTTDLPKESDGWFAKSIEQWCDDTGMTRDELAGARRLLRDLWLLQERKVRQTDLFAPPRLEFRVNLRRLSELLCAYAEWAHPAARRARGDDGTQAFVPPPPGQLALEDAAAHAPRTN